MAAVSQLFEGMHMPDYVGDEIDDLIDQVSGVGAVARAKAPGNAQMARSSRDVGKRAPLGFGTYSLATLASTTLTTRVQRAFAADRLLITSSALGITVTSIKVGDEEQVLGGGVPAELYGPTAMADSKADDFTPSPGGIDFSITLNNTSGASIVGAVGMKGYVKR
jgi:hypothetical protein